MTAFLFASCKNGKKERERKYLEEWSEDIEFSLAYFPEVEKKKGEVFRIMLFTDLQLWMELSVNDADYYGATVIEIDEEVKLYNMVKEK